MSTKHFLIKTAVRVLLFAAISVVVLAALKTPVLTNEIALGQMTNSNYLFVTYDLYNKLRPIITAVYTVAILVFVGSTISNMYKFFKEK